MQHYTNTVLDTSGNVLPGATVTVYLAGTTNVATIYSDNGITPTGNPLSTASDGTYHFYAASGAYDLVIAKTGFTFVAAETAGIVLCGYDEGTWTPSVGGTATYTLQTGTYIKVGNLVTVFCRMTINAIGTGSTSVISGLPFIVRASPIVYGAAAVYVTSLSQNVVMVTGLAGAGGATSMTLYSLLAAGASMAQNAILGSGTAVYFSVSYPV